MIFKNMKYIIYTILVVLKWSLNSDSASDDDEPPSQKLSKKFKKHKKHKNNKVQIEYDDNSVNSQNEDAELENEPDSQGRDLIFYFCRRYLCIGLIL